MYNIYVTLAYDKTTKIPTIKSNTFDSDSDCRKCSIDFTMRFFFLQLLFWAVEYNCYNVI